MTKFVVFKWFYLLIWQLCHSPMAMAFAPMKGVSVTSVATGKPVDLGDYLSEQESLRAMVVFGTYAADFNAIEMAQRLRYYLPKLKEKCGISKCALILNCNADAAKALISQVDLPTDATISKEDSTTFAVTLLIDELGTAGRKFGVGRGWLPDNDDVNPFLKLFGMLWGLGAWATLPAVIGGYIGNPFVGQPWIEDALAVGQRMGRWPDTALELAPDGTVTTNKFSELPLVGEWPRRPLELATLRLQSMLGISISKWKELAPDDKALQAGVLTQLGGCLVVDSKTGESVYEWRDPGICAVTNFEDVIKKLS
jgi:AhpC/TSA antioxidant enzyme